jgi:hypothetical protein
MSQTKSNYTGDGVTVLYSITFPYLQTEHIKASINGTPTTDFVFANATTVQFNVAPANGADIVLFRDTPIDELENKFFPNSSITSSSLNENFTQGLYVAQETNNTSQDAFSAASTAVTTANQAALDASAAVVTANQAEINSLSALSVANLAESNSIAAVNTANLAESNSLAAVSTANSASSAASAAVITANAADATATQASIDAAAAVVTANQADADATLALSTANQADANASLAVSTANQAAGDAAAAVITANTAESNSLAAVSTANSAAAAVAAAVFYQPVIDLTALALLTPLDGEFFELQNSTGAETDPSITGVPIGLVGSAGLTFRLRYDDPPGEYAFLGYFANDSETRYIKSGVGAIVDADVSTTADIDPTKILGVAVVDNDSRLTDERIPTDGSVTDAKVSATANIADTKLATITTAGKVNNSATTADSANTASAIVARDASGNFSAGTITADLAGNASTVTTNADLTGDVTSVGNATSIAAGVIVDADVNASAAIAGTKINPDFGSQNVVTTGDAQVKDVVASGNVQAGAINGGPLAGFRNAIINGNFDIWQRGTSFTGNEYGADRWLNNRAGSTCTMSRQEFALGQTDVPGEPTYFVRMAVASVAGANNRVILQQPIEDVRTFAGQQITISFYAKADASKTIAIEFQQIFGAGGTPSSVVTAIGTVKKSLTTSWQKVTHTITVPSISGKTLGTDGNDRFAFSIFFDAGSDFNARTDTLGHQSGTFDIAQVQVEAGPVATPFERRPIGTELALCQRYFQAGFRTFNSYGFTGWGYTSQFTFPVTMRATPTMSQSISGLVNIATSSIGAYDKYTGFLEATLSSNSNAFYASLFTASAEL